MKITEITTCYIGPEISPEQFVAEHVFMYLAKGFVQGYDGLKTQALKAGEYCLIKKNSLARYSKQKDNGAFEKVVIIFDELFLKAFKKKHSITSFAGAGANAFLLLKKNARIPHFIKSLVPYYNSNGKIDHTFTDLKREELLLILLQQNPELARVLFDFGIPEKIFWKRL